MTDAGVGRAMFTTRVGLSVQAFQMCFWFGAIPLFILPMLIWFYSASIQDVSMVKIDLLTHIVSDSESRKWKLTNNKDVRTVVSVVLYDGREVQLFTPAQVKRILVPFWRPVNTFHFYLYASFLLAIIGHLAVWYSLKTMGARNQENQRLGGANYIVTARALNRMIRRNAAGSYKLVGVTLPKTAPTTGILALGSQGTGKSVAIHDLMMQAFAKKRKCFIYDQSGEFFRAHYRPGKDYFFNPALVGSVPWSLLTELVYSYDADTMGRSFLPPKNEGTGGPNSFFEDAARTLFSVILLRLRQRGAKYTSDIATAFLEMPDEEMDFLISKSVASSAVGGDSKAQRQGVISSISIFLNGISAVQKGTWSIKDFLDSPDDARLFILGTEDTRAMFAPLFRLMLAVAFSSIESKQEIVHEDRYWFFLDEVHQLGDIRLDEKLATLRKFGVCIFSGVQSDQQFMAALGRERGEVVMNCFNTVLMLRANDDKLQERIARRLGKVDETVVNRNQQLAVTEWRDGGGLNQVDREKFVVSPSDIGNLDVCVGYLKLVGAFPAAKVDYRSWLPKAPGKPAYIDRWKEINAMPVRDQDFVINVVDTGDVFKSVRDDVQRVKQEETDGAEMVDRPTTIWARVPDAPVVTSIPEPESLSYPMTEQALGDTDNNSSKPVKTYLSVDS
jgi:hypothetical protein